MTELWLLGDSEFSDVSHSSVLCGGGEQTCQGLTLKQTAGDMECNPCVCVTVADPLSEGGAPGCLSCKGRHLALCPAVFR